MHVIQISGGLMIIIGTCLTLIPIVRWAVGSILFLIGGATCLTGMIQKYHVH